MLITPELATAVDEQLPAGSVPRPWYGNVATAASGVQNVYRCTPGDPATAVGLPRSAPPAITLAPVPCWPERLTWLCPYVGGDHEKVSIV